MIYYFFIAVALSVNLSVLTMQTDCTKVPESALALSSQAVRINCQITAILEKKQQEYSANHDIIASIDDAIMTSLLNLSERLKKLDNAVDKPAKKKYEVNDAYINNVMLTISNALRDRSKIKDLSSSDAVYVGIDEWMRKLEKAMAELKEAIKQEHK